MASVSQKVTAFSQLYQLIKSSILSPWTKLEEYAEEQEF